MEASNRMKEKKTAEELAAMIREDLGNVDGCPEQGVTVTVYGLKLFTLKQAIAWLAKEIPQSEHTMKEVQTAAHCVTEAAENNGPMIFARMGMMQAINRHKREQFDPSRKGPHWGKRKLARDQ